MSAFIAPSRQTISVSGSETPPHVRLPSLPVREDVSGQNAAPHKQTWALHRRNMVMWREDSKQNPKMSKRRWHKKFIQGLKVQHVGSMSLCTVQFSVDWTAAASWSSRSQLLFDASSVWRHPPTSATPDAKRECLTVNLELVNVGVWSLWLHLSGEEYTRKVNLESLQEKRL